MEMLTDEEAGGVFQTFKDLMVFAAALGFASERRVEFERSAEPIPWSVFGGPQDEAMVNMIAATEEETLDILSNARFDDRLRIFEEYAMGGLDVLSERFQAETAGVLESLVKLVQDTEVRGEEPSDLGDLLREIRVV
jgi:dnd system-associated protein 4